MASGNGKNGSKSPPYELAPPPSLAAARRKSPLTTSESQEVSTRPPLLDREPASTPPPIPPRRASLNRRSDDSKPINENSILFSTEGQGVKKTGVTKSNSLYTKDSAPIFPAAQQNQNRMSLPVGESNPTAAFHPDLEGLDFNASGGTFADPHDGTQLRSASMEDLNNINKPMYPDISHAFREITGNRYNYPTLAPPYPANNMMPVLPSVGGSQAGVGVGRPPPMESTSNFGWVTPTSNPCPQGPAGQPPGFPLSHQPMPASLPYPQQQQPGSFTPNAFNGRAPPGIGFSSSPNNMFIPFNTTPGGPLLAKNEAYNFPIGLNSSAAYDSATSNNFNPSNNFNSSNNFSENRGFNTNTPIQSSFPYVPNISLPRPASLGDVLEASRESSLSPIDNQSHPIVVAGFDERLAYVAPSTDEPSEGRDLIKLGVTLPEHEYLSLDYFDPLYSRGRRESICLSNSPASINHAQQTNYSFGEAFPNVYQADFPPGSAAVPSASAAYDHKKNDDHIWMPVKGSSVQQQSKPPPGIGFEAFDFDAFGHAKFGTSDEEFLRGSAQPSNSAPALPTAAYDAFETTSKKVSGEKPQRPPSWKVPQGKHYERLRKRTFIDPESESFCQMVADLKRQYLSTDEKTNQGYLVNQIRDSHLGSIQVKLTVHTQFSEDPVSFTCDTSALVEHVISHVLCTLSPNDLQANTDSYILKVYDRAEYFCNDLPLAKFDYTHSCLKLDRDIDLELISCEEVTRPFIRTRDDDIQMLYFPKEYINAEGKAVSQDALAVYIDTFYHEVDVLLEHFSKDGTGTFHTLGLQQSVKALCVNLARVETTDIIKALEKLDKKVSELASPSSQTSNMYKDSGVQDRETQDAINVAVRCSLVEDLEEAADQLVEAVKRLVRMYCRTFLTDFFLGSSIEIPHDHQEVVKVKDNFIACIASAHRIPNTWANKFEEYKIVCSLYYGTKRLIPDLATSLKPLTNGLCERIVWDEWLQFEQTYLCTMPRETRLCMVLCGVRSAQGGDKAEFTEGKKVIYPLGAAAIQLFNEKGYLVQGPQLVPLVMGVGLDPIMPSCKTLLPDSVLLQVNLPDFERTIFFPEPLNAPHSPVKSFDILAPDVRGLVVNLMEKESCSSFSPEELEILWSHRHYMTDQPSLLPRILQAAHSWDWASLAEIYSLLKHWKTLHPMQSFELLLPQFPDVRVRQFAAESLNKIPTDDLVDFLPQMIQGLKFESYHNSPLAKLLLEQSCKSPRFAHQFFWLLKGVAAQEATFKRRYELMFVALASVAGDALYQEFRKQEELVKVMTSIAEKVVSAKDKDATLRRELMSLHEMLEEKGRVVLPYNPSVEVIGLDMKSCSYFTSNAFPLKLVFKNSNPKADSHYVIYKVGDDLRQDMLTLQMIRIMDTLWLQQGLDLKMITFACLATGPKKGVIELITESDTLRKIQVSCGVTGSFKDRPIKEWLQKHNPTELEYKKAVENFTYSCAGYCVATYVLGVGDRHNDNIMLKQSGHMFHIDFSKFLGDAQMFGSFKRDRVPFVLTSDMAYVINDGGRQGHKFQHFVDLCCQAFNILRKHADLFRSLFILMARSGIPGVTERAVQYVQNTLLPGQTDAQATATFTRMIEESMKSVFTQFNFFFHNLAQLKFSSHTEGALLSFVPKVYSKETDGKITVVELTGFQKRYTPDKHYIFLLKIERENQKVPMYVFRHFPEFVEFRDKLAEMFPLVTWPNFSTRVVIGRSNIRTVAESRKTEINNFLRYLWTKAVEVSQCELVYTFFHPLLRDEQEAEKTKLNVTKLREPLVQRTTNAGNSGIQGDIKLSVQYKRDALQVMVMHVRGLLEGSQLPSPYVKTYLLPDPEKQTKLKTKMVKNTSHPTYNELLQYQLPQLEICHRILQVTVWDYDMLKENNFLGAVYIKLRELDLAKDNTTWHKLGRMQM